MKSTLRVVPALLLLAVTLSAQSLTPIVGGTGVDGAYNPVSNTIIDSDLTPLLQLTTLNIPAGVTVTCVGSSPLTLKVQGAVVIDGVLDASGLPGGTGGNNSPGGLGGAGTCGGGAGGDGGADPLRPFTDPGLPGQGRSPGQPGMVTGTAFADPVGGGGGGGNATAGTAGGVPNSGSALYASGPGGPALQIWRAGSGGGGGAADIDSTTAATSNDGGGGGGGGGAMLTISTDTSIWITGSLLVDGGAGGTSSGNGGGGGGGSGGSVVLVAPTMTLDGTVSALGGVGGSATQSNCGCSPGGAGGDGSILLVGNYTIGGAGVVTPAPLTQPLYSVMSSTCPRATVQVTTPGSETWAIAYSLSLTQATPLGFQLSMTDPLFTLLWPVNVLPLNFGPLVGIGTATTDVDFSTLPLPLDYEFTIYAQAAFLDSMSNLSVSNVLPIWVRY